MCGIAGIIYRDAATVESALRKMNAAQRHRGPDDEGLNILRLPCGVLGLGHRRLSILDLTPAGHQPMQNSETGDWVVFNGEIYNFLELRAELEACGANFRTRCDTEVILHSYAKWGNECFNRFDGMFALALYNGREKQLILARDPLGIKPLYYASDRESFVFASELRAIRAAGIIDCVLDRRAIATALAYGAVATPLTMYRKARMLEPGSIAELDLSTEQINPTQMRTRRFWSYPTPIQDVSPDNRVSTLDSLTKAARNHLISDVPIGIFLSSGIDSTAVATLCSAASKAPIETFTFRFSEDSALDESAQAEAIAQLLNARHHTITLSDAEVRQELVLFLKSMDQPSMDGFNTFIISSAVRQRGIVVALSGLGGDELFAGYSTFRQVPKLLQFARMAAGIPKGIRSALASALFIGRSHSRRVMASEIAGSKATLRHLYFRRRRLLSDYEMRLLGLKQEELDLDEDYMPAEADPERGLLSDDPVASISILESRFYMGNMLLRDADVFGMAHGLEIRVPFLSRDVFDCAYSIPGQERLGDGKTSKPVLVNALNGRLSRAVLTAKKRGFSLPFAKWMTGPLRDSFQSYVNNLADSGIVEASGVRKIWAQFLADPNSPAWSRSWMLGVLGSHLMHLESRQN